MKFTKHNAASSSPIGQDNHARALLVAHALAGAWRKSPPALELTVEQLEQVAAPLLESGAGALGWRRISASCDSSLIDTPAASKLHQAYRLHTLHAALAERVISHAFALLRDARIEALVIKGWAAARLYTETGLRPFGDVDLCVRADQHARAHSVLKVLEASVLPVDLHAGFSTLDAGRWEDLYERAECVELDGVPVRFPRAEDHLRMLAQHLWQHGGWRPLWLCDVAAAVETRSPGFDWNLCLTTKRASQSVLTALRLAHQLLGAKIHDTPAAERAARLPRWLVQNVLQQWDAPRAQLHFQIEMKTHLRHPSMLVEGLRRRWPNPIEATAALGAPLNGWPRFPFQLTSFIARAFKFLAHTPLRSFNQSGQDF